MLHRFLDYHSLCIKLSIHNAKLFNWYTLGKIYNLWMEVILQVYSLDVWLEKSNFVINSGITYRTYLWSGLAFFRWNCQVKIPSSFKQRLQIIVQACIKCRRWNEQILSDPAASRLFSFLIQTIKMIHEFWSFF